MHKEFVRNVMARKPQSSAHLICSIKSSIIYLVTFHKKFKIRYISYIIDTKYLSVSHISNLLLFDYELLYMIICYVLVNFYNYNILKSYGNKYFDQLSV